MNFDILFYIKTTMIVCDKICNQLKSITLIVHIDFQIYFFREHKYSMQSYYPYFIFIYCYWLIIDLY